MKKGKRKSSSHCKPSLTPSVTKQNKQHKKREAGKGHSTNPAKAVETKRPKKSAAPLQGRAVKLPDVEPWPKPVDGAAVLNAVAERVRSYVAMPDFLADVCALWAAHAHAFKSFQFSPRLNISS